MDQFFDNQAEPQIDKPEKMSYGQKVFDVVKGINVEFRKKKKDLEDGTKTRKKRKWGKMEEEEAKHVAPTVPFKKQSCFFNYLSYWKVLDMPHAVDCMHLVKNVFESMIGVLLDIKTNTKDGLKSRLDLVN
jgi:hypothetical protein